MLADEVDSVLNDELVQSLIVRSCSSETNQLYHRACYTLTDYAIDIQRTIGLNDSGIDKAEEFNLDNLYDIDNVAPDPYWDNAPCRNYTLHYIDHGSVLSEILSLTNIQKQNYGSDVARWLHRAIEAKENWVQEETKTSASPLLKICSCMPRNSGMTGTGKNSEDEFVRWTCEYSWFQLGRPLGIDHLFNPHPTLAAKFVQ